MKIEAYKNRKTHGYRGNRQKGKFVALTSIVPRAIAKVVNAEAMLRNKSVSVIIAEILAERYFEDAELRTRRGITR